MKRLLCVTLFLADVFMRQRPSMPLMQCVYWYGTNNSQNRDTGTGPVSRRSDRCLFAKATWHHTVRTAKLDDPDQGLSAHSARRCADLLESHRRVKEQDDQRSEAIVQQVMDGKLSLIALHSAHWAKPFVRLMQRASEMGCAAAACGVRTSNGQVGVCK